MLPLSKKEGNNSHYAVLVDVFAIEDTEHFTSYIYLLLLHPTTSLLYYTLIYISSSYSSVYLTPRHGFPLLLHSRIYIFLS